MGGAPGAPPRAPLPSILAYKYDSHHARLLPLSSAYRRHSGYNATTTAIHRRWSSGWVLGWRDGARGTRTPTLLAQHVALGGHARAVTTSATLGACASRCDPVHRCAPRHPAHRGQPREALLLVRDRGAPEPQARPTPAATRPSPELPSSRSRSRWNAFGEPLKAGIPPKRSEIRIDAEPGRREVIRHDQELLQQRQRSIGLPCD